jgi:exodeoxyribonuclease V gamma subunit
LCWPILAVLDQCQGQDWCSVLDDHLGATRAAGDPLGEQRRSRRLGLARRIGELFDSYCAQRPQMMRGWSRGDDDDGYRTSLPPEYRWQPELWRRLVATVESDPPPQRLTAAISRLHTDPAHLALGARVSVFGPTRLSASDLALLQAVGEHRDLHLWLPHPSPGLWSALDGQVAGRRRDDETASLVRNRLLRHLGRDSRELRLRLNELRGFTDVHHDPVGAAGPLNVLGRLQQAIVADRRLEPGGTSVGDTAAGDIRVADTSTIGDASRPDPPAIDSSVQVHACHGRSRQVEVLREVITGLLQDHPTLQARDILVMCPDIEVFAPLVLANFGAADDLAAGHPGADLRVRLADRSLRQTNPVLDVVARMLALARSRVTSLQLLDLAAVEPVRRRFGFDDDALHTLARWTASANIRWGLTAADRRPFGLDDVADNTWHRGLDRVLHGVTMEEGDHQGLANGLPLDDVESSDIELAGAFTEFVTRVAWVLRGLSGARPLSDWTATLLGAVDRLTMTSAGTGWQQVQARRILAGPLNDAVDDVPLRLGDVEALLTGELRGRPTRASFRTGDLTICSMVPMRSVPHRVVCLLGLDDGDFPRATIHDGDDVLAIDPVVGERDIGAQDRQLLLDAVLAATEHLVVVYSGFDERTGARRPPAVPVGDLLDTLAAVTGARSPAGVVTDNTLQPHDRRNFVPGRSGEPFSFDAEALAAARALSGPISDPAPFLSHPLPPQVGAEIDLQSLVRFLEHPVRGFLRQRLGISMRDDHDEVPEELSVELDGLTRWAIGDRMLRARLAGQSQDQVSIAERRRGDLPPGALGAPTLDTIARAVEAILTAAAPCLGEPETSVPARARLPRGRSVAGTVSPIRGGVLTRVEYSRISARHRLGAWVRLLTLVAGGAPVTSAVTLGGSARGYLLAAPDPGQAADALADLVALYTDGLRAPLPLPVGCALGYAQARAQGRTPAQAAGAAERAWSARYGEARDAEHIRVFGAVDFAAILRRPLPDQPCWPHTRTTDPVGGLDWRAEPSAFGRLAVALFTPMLSHETPLR